MATEELMEYEYELIDIRIDNGYEQGDEDNGWNACEETSADNPAAKIVYDADGIPMGDSPGERLIRRGRIHEHIQQWRAHHADDPRIFNENLNGYIKINQVFLLESVMHFAIRYKSTKAIMKMDEVMAMARKVSEVPTKKGNSNQKPFEKMIVMRYDSEELGSVKMVVGVRNRTREKVEYSITVPEESMPFIDESMRSDKKNVKKKKHHK